MDGKTVPQSKLSEWKGLDRISQIVHSMGFVYREQEKDDLGIDGEIEICDLRSDGKGRVSTGKILKVQSKSGSSFIRRDTADSFAAQSNEKDLRYWRVFDIPVLFNVYHPGDDALYWKHVQDYIETTDNVFSSPIEIVFDKAKDRFDVAAYDRLFELCHLAADRVSHDRGETLYTNLLTVEALPQTIWVTPVRPDRRARFHERLGGSTLRKPPYVFRSGTIVTLTDPEATENALRETVERGSPEEFEMADWVAQDDQNENDLRALMRAAFHRHLRKAGLFFDKDQGRYFFNEGLEKTVPLRRSWTSPRTNKTHSRFVAKFHEYGTQYPVRYFKHSALRFGFERFGEEWGLMLNPSLAFTVDGTKRATGLGAMKHLRRARAMHYNNIYMNDILFWSHLVSGGLPSFGVSVEGEEVLRVAGVPTTLDAPFSVRTSERQVDDEG